MLLARLYDPDSGSVELDGVSLRRLPSTAIPALVGSLSQQPFLFRDTVGANIRLGRPEASQEEVEAAAKAAAIHDTIMALPKVRCCVVTVHVAWLTGVSQCMIGGHMCAGLRYSHCCSWW